MMEMRTFNIGFTYWDGTLEIKDETQFGIEDTGDFTGMCMELITLFNKLVFESGMENYPLTIDYIEEVSEE